MKELEGTYAFGIRLDMTLKMIKQDIIRRFRNEGIDLTPEQWTILHKVNECGMVSQRELAEGTFKDAPTVSRIIDLMDSKGYLERKPDIGDRRRFIISLTDCGRELLGRSTPIIADARNNGWDGLGKDDYQDLKRILDRIYSNILNGQ